MKMMNIYIGRISGFPDEHEQGFTGERLCLTKKNYP